MSKSMLLLCIIVRQSSIVVLLSKLKPTTVAVPRPPGANCSCCRHPHRAKVAGDGVEWGNVRKLRNFVQLSTIS